MKKSGLSFWTVLMLAAAGMVYAQEQTAGGVFRPQEEQAPKQTVLPQVRDKISRFALKNLMQSELAFCYTVENAGTDETAYALDNMKVTGFCGILSDAELALFREHFLNKEENLSSVVADCVIQPRIMFRFINGVDNTDVLLSSPCESFSVFYGGEVRSFNMSPGAIVVSDFVRAYEGRKVNFVSPALLGQVLPIGVPNTQEQRNLVKEKAAPKAVRNWQTNEPSSESTTTSAPKGWNRLRGN